MAKFLIIGGAGFIGSNFAKYVLSKGHSVYIVDNFSTGNMDNVEEFVSNERVELFKFDGIDETKNTIQVIPDFDAASVTFYTTNLRILKQRCDYIIHLAASVGVQYVEDNPNKTILNNLEMEQHVFSINEELQKPIFFASTSEVYGEGFSRASGEMDDFRETDTLTIGAPTHTRWGYACSKLMGEFLLHSYTQPFVIGRFFNVTSRNQVSDYGMVLPTFVKKALRNEPITIYGTGLAVRCYCHVDDAVRAMYTTITTPRCYRQIFNIGKSVETSVYDLASRVRSLVGSDVKIEFDKDGCVTISVPIIVKYGYNIPDVATKVQDAIKAAIDNATNIDIKDINVSVQEIEKSASPA